MTSTRILATVTLLVALPLGLAAQDVRHRPIPNKFEEKTFTLPYNEFARLWLDGGETYRVEIEGTGISLRLAPIDEAHEPVLIKPLLLGRSASGTALYTVQVRDSGFYNLTAVGGQAGRAVDVRISEEPDPPDDAPKGAKKDSAAAS